MRMATSWVRGITVEKEVKPRNVVAEIEKEMGQRAAFFTRILKSSWPDDKQRASLPL